MIDLKRTWYSHVDSQPLVPGKEVVDEGQCLVSVLVDGLEHVQPSTGAAGEVFAGFAVFRQLSHETAPNVELVTVPAAPGPYVVTLSYNNLVAGSVLVLDDAGVVVAPAAVDLLAGKVTFAVGQAGLTLKVHYRFELTVAQAKQLFQEAVSNYPSANLIGQCGVGKGKGRIYLSYYDTSVDWANHVGPLCLGADGMVAAAGPVEIPGSRVVHVPAVGVLASSSAQMLGIEFNA